MIDGYLISFTGEGSTLDRLAFSKAAFYNQGMVRPLHIKNARVWNGREAEIRDLYTTDVVVEKPPHDALEIDLEGYTIFPGLINAHDHLELNHYPRSKFREVYNNAHEWGEDMNARLDTEPYKSLRAYPLWDRLFIGGLKNLLCGATTVAHHNPPHKELFRKDFPVRVLGKYGWAHSLHFNTDEEIVASYRSTPKDVPWFIHLAEGTDEVAAGEYRRLKALGCVGKNTVIVHGVGLRKPGQPYPVSPEISTDLVADDVRGIVWCPTSNLYLLGKTLIDEHNNHFSPVVNSMGLGSDSRLTSDGDLLDELRVALRQFGDGWANFVVNLVFYDGGFVLFHRSERDWIFGQQQVDLVIIATAHDDAIALCNSRRADLALVVKGGVPQIGDPAVMAKFPHIQTVPAILDGRPKAIHIALAKRILQCKLKERGLEVDAPPKGRRFVFRGI
jgi:hypothetical protein